MSTTLIQVRSYELDSFGHANHAVFVNYFEQARYDALRQAGHPYEAIIDRGWRIYVVRIEVDYVKEARLGDTLRIQTRAESFRRATMTLAQEIVKDADPDVTVARARVTAVWIGENRRPMRVPAEVQAALSGDPREAQGGDRRREGRASNHP